MIAQDWLSTFKEGDGKKISRILFITYTTQISVTKQFNFNAWQRNMKKYPNKAYALPIVNHYFQFWEEEKFITKSAPLREREEVLTEEWKKKLRYLPKNYCLSWLNLEPIYRYCEGEKIKPFTDEEKEFLNGVGTGLFSSEQIRRLILFEYPKEDIIQATLKFYVKHYVMPYGYLARFSEMPLNNEMKEKIEQAKKKAEEVNRDKWFPKYSMKQQRNSENYYIEEGFGKEEAKRMAEQMKEISKEVNKKIKNKTYTYLDVISHDNLTDGFSYYVSKYKENPKMVLSVDKKITEALGIPVPY